MGPHEAQLGEFRAVAELPFERIAVATVGEGVRVFSLDTLQCEAVLIDPLQASQPELLAQCHNAGVDREEHWRSRRRATHFIAAFQT